MLTCSQIDGPRQPHPSSGWRRFAKALVFIIYVAVICFIGGEVAIRIFYDRFSDYNMEMWRYAADLKQPLTIRNLPFHHFPSREGTYYGSKISTNSLGLREREYAAEKPGGVTRVIFLGDSFTMGWGVAFEDLYSKRLEQLLNAGGGAYEVVNMGTGNYNTVMELELFKWKGLALDPDMVILMFFLNDVEPVPKARSGVTYAVMGHSYFVSFLFDRFTRLRSRFLRTFEWSTYYRDLYSPKNAANLSAASGAVTEIAGLCRKSGVPLLVVNIPELRELRPYRFGYATDFMRGLAEENGVPFLDLLPALSIYPPSSLWVSAEDPHANGKANAVIAQAIYEKIISEQLLE